MFEETKYLPGSARRYLVTQYGEIKDSAGRTLPLVFENGEHWVELTWVSGTKKYSAGMVVLVAYRQIALEEHLWEEIEPLFKDGDPKNLNVVNLTYRFRCGPLEVEGMPAFFYVPFFTRYAINRDGELRNIETGHVLSWYVTKEKDVRSGGYRAARVSNESGFSRTIFRHRALSLTFKRYNASVNQIVVNHKNGQKGDDRLDNLEWATHATNNQHAYDTGLRASLQSVWMRDLNTGEEHLFPSIAECHRQTGKLTPNIIQYRLSKCPNKVFSDRLLFKYDDGSNWPEVDAGSVSRHGSGGGIVARNVFTGDLVIGTSAQHLEDLLGVKSGTILQHARDNLVLPAYGYNFRYVIGGDPFPNHSARHLAVYKDHPIKSPDGIVVTDLTTNEEQFFTSRQAAAHHFDLSPVYVFNLAQGEKTYQSKYRFNLFKLKEELGPPIEQSIA